MKTIHQEIWIDADRTTVFAALTTREGIDGWWGQVLAAEPEVGSVVELDHGLEAPLRMRVMDLSPNQRVVWRCVSDFTDTRNPGSDWLGKTFAFTLRTAEGEPAFEWLGPRFEFGTATDVTILDFRNPGWTPDDRWYAFCNAAWATTLDGPLRESCEAGKP